MTTSKKKQFIVSISEDLLEDTRNAYIPEDMLDNDEYDLVLQDIIIRGFMDFDENTLRDYCNPKTKGKVVSVEPIKCKIIGCNRKVSKTNSYCFHHCKKLGI